VLLSARLNPVAVHHLLKATQAETIISAPKLRRVVCEIFPLFGTQDGMTEPPVQCYIGFSYESFLSAANDDDKPQSETICYPGYYISESDCSAIILHSSGTTGLPKPVYQPHRWLLSFCANYQYDSIDEATAPILSTLPVYHVSLQ
jgi:acyl-CoA synthetase (AMP-forming)/AMP-acid ligase II